MSNDDGSPRDPASGLSSEDLVEVLRESVDEVFLTMLGTVAVLVDHVESGDQSRAEEGQVEENHAGLEAVVDFSGRRSGAVILRAGMHGAVDIARGLLMLGDDEEVPLEEVEDALGECANMLSGLLKTKVLDPIGCFSLGTPRIGRSVNLEYANHLGGLVYKLSNGSTEVEVWMDQENGATQ